MSDNRDSDDRDFSPHRSPVGTEGKALETVENQPFDEAVSLSDDSSVSDDHQDSEPEERPSGFYADDAMLVTNQSYDEAIDVSDATSMTASPNVMGSMMGDEDGDSSSDPGAGGNNHTPGAGVFNDESESSSESDEDAELQAMNSPQMDTDSPAVFKPIEGGYDPADYEDLDASDEVKDLFMYISRYQAQHVDLECALKPFIPEFIPSVGDIDAFLRVPRPDGVEDETGLRVLDEPAADQSDRTVLEMQLRAFTKQTGLAAQTVAQIEDAQSNPAAIKKWIASVEALHATKPATGVTFSKAMPDIEALMQVCCTEGAVSLVRCGLNNSRRCWDQSLSPHHK
eukprot:TRINITY_DN1917_c0_g1_i1.p1 TRINITY_DN1917_c0_g1~~TRINITY_DN1917_c0_g1_i1.p1  ORF type:complete len:341 (+),score=90.06 TRINITY_DN1917_c0_g1_i1:223-1245(+)